MEVMGIGQRIKELMFRLDLNQSSLAEIIGVSQTAIYKTVNGQTKPRYSLLESICTNFPQVNKDWLIEGTGAMFKEVTPISQNSEGGYLQEHLLRLEERFAVLSTQLEVKDKQLEVKDKQMEAKDRQIELLISQLGKPKDVIEETQIVPLWREVSKADKAYA